MISEESLQSERSIDVRIIWSQMAGKEIHYIQTGMPISSSDVPTTSPVTPTCWFHDALPAPLVLCAHTLATIRWELYCFSGQVSVRYQLQLHKRW